HLLELGSTHPLTGNRLARLGEVARRYGQQFSFDIDVAVRSLHVDRSRLYREFWAGLLVSLLPLASAIASLFFLPLAYLPAAFGVAMVLQIPYKFPRGAPAETSVLEQMT